MKRTCTIIMLTTLICMGSIHTNAHDFEVDGMYYNIVSISELTCEVTYRGSDYYDARFTYFGNITVPESVQYNGRTLKVVGVGDHAFDNYDWWNKEKESITSISLPNSIEYLGDYALAYNSFSDFEVPSSLKKIGKGAFHYSVSEGVKRVYINDLKAWCEIEFGDSQSSPFAAYMEDSGIDDDGRPNTTGIGRYHIGDFYINNELAEHIIIPEDVKKVNKYAFVNIGSIKEIILTEAIEAIEDFAFCNCTNLESIKIPSTCKEIKQHAFNGCGNLKKVDLPEGIESIGFRSFKDCVSLDSITLPSTIEHLGRKSFEGAKLSLLKVSYSPTPIFFERASLFDIESIYFQRDFTCNFEKVINRGWCNSPFTSYYDAEDSKLKKVTIGKEVKKIPARLFTYCNIESIIIDKSETPLSIGFCNYYTNSSWKEIRFRSAFYKQPIQNVSISRLLTIDLQEEQIDGYRPDVDSLFFEGCTKIERASILHNINATSSYFEFEKCPNLSKIELGKCVTPIPDFSANNKLDSIVVINDVPPVAIGFANTTYLHCKLFVPNGCKSVYKSADVWKNFWNIVELEQNFNSLGVASHNKPSEIFETARYTIDGIRILTPKHGLNIIRKNDGTVKKVVVK